MPKPPTIDPNRSLASQAVMNVQAGEEVAGAWATAPVPQIGVYKLLAKKKADGTYEWAHFVQRDSGLKENVYRGAVESEQRLADVLTALNSALRKSYGPHIQLRPADADVYTVGGKKDSGAVH